MLLCLYQIFILPLGHLHFFLRFFLTFMENLFMKHPISKGLDLRFIAKKCLIFYSVYLDSGRRGKDKAP